MKIGTHPVSLALIKIKVCFFEVGAVLDYAAFFTIPICYSVFLLSV